MKECWKLEFTHQLSSTFLQALLLQLIFRKAMSALCPTRNLAGILVYILFTFLNYSQHSLCKRDNSQCYEFFRGPSHLCQFFCRQWPRSWSSLGAGDGGLWRNWFSVEQIPFTFKYPNGFLPEFSPFGFRNHRFQIFIRCSLPPRPPISDSLQ